MLLTDSEEAGRLEANLKALNDTETKLEDISKTGSLQTVINNTRQEIREERTKEAAAARDLRNYDASFRKSLENNYVNDLRFKRKQIEEQEHMKGNNNALYDNTKGFTADDRIKLDGLRRQRKQDEEELNLISSITGDVNHRDVENNHNKILLNINDDVTRRGVTQKEINERQEKLEEADVDTEKGKKEDERI